MSLSTDVVIVGGGFAGLSIAKEFSRVGIDFAILEARDRIGGRVFTHQLEENITIDPRPSLHMMKKRISFIAGSRAGYSGFNDK